MIEFAPGFRANPFHLHDHNALITPSAYVASKSKHWWNYSLICVSCIIILSALNSWTEWYICSAGLIRTPTAICHWIHGIGLFLALLSRRALYLARTAHPWLPVCITKHFEPLLRQDCLLMPTWRCFCRLFEPQILEKKAVDLDIPAIFRKIFQPILKSRASKHGSSPHLPTFWKHIDSCHVSEYFSLPNPVETLELHDGRNMTQLL